MLVYLRDESAQTITYMLVYLMDESAQTVTRAPTLR